MIHNSALSTCLRQLFDFLEQWELPPPTREVRIVEVSRPITIDERGRYVLSGDVLQKPSEYEARFDELMHSGWPWVNMSCFGVYNGFLIIGIVYPGYAPKEEHRHRPPSVNYSGPQTRVIQHGWDADEMMVIV